jgi:DNA-directed RNA polymerase specialized sigma subunit
MEINRFTMDEPLRVVRSLALRQQIEQLPALEREVIALLYGIGCAPLPREDIAERLGLTDIEVWRIGDRATRALGVGVCMEAAA